MPGLDFTEKHARTPAAASTRMLLATIAMKDLELDHVDVDHAFILAAVEEEISIALPQKYQDLPGVVGKLNRSLYWLVQASRNRHIMFTDALKDMGFE